MAPADAAEGCNFDMVVEPSSPCVAAAEEQQQLQKQRQQRRADRRQQQRGELTTTSTLQLLEVVEDKQGDSAAGTAGGAAEVAVDVLAAGPAGQEEVEEEEVAAYASDEASEEELSGLGSGRTLYTRCAHTPERNAWWRGVGRPCRSALPHPLVRLPGRCSLRCSSTSRHVDHPYIHPFAIHACLGSPCLPIQNDDAVTPRPCRVCGGSRNSSKPPQCPWQRRC